MRIFDTLTPQTNIKHRDEKRAQQATSSGEPSFLAFLSPALHGPHNDSLSPQARSVCLHLLGNSRHSSLRAPMLLAGTPGRPRLRLRRSDSLAKWRLRTNDSLAKRRTNDSLAKRRLRTNDSLGKPRFKSTEVCSIVPIRSSLLQHSVHFAQPFVRWC
jgi:hypothetical protein